MNYEEVLKQIAKKYNISTKEVEQEMQKALNLAGYNIEPKIFIASAIVELKKTIYRN